VSVACPSSELLESVLTRLADSDLVQRQAELLRQGAVHVVDQLRDRAVEAEAGFHADGEQVERIRKLSPNLVASLAGARADDEVRGEEADPAERKPEEEYSSAADGSAAQKHAQQEGADSDGRLPGQETGGRNVAESRGQQAAAHAVHAGFRVDAEDELGQAVSRRPKDALAERLLSLAECGADLAVVRGSLDRPLAFSGGGRDGLADQIGRAGEEQDGEDN
jgi:hypothetical protein